MGKDVFRTEITSAIRWPGIKCSTMYSDADTLTVLGFNSATAKKKKKRKQNISFN